MEERKCSWTAIKEYDTVIKEYLISKNITNFNKFEISFKEGKLYFKKWEYDIEKPKNIKPKPKQINYLDLYARLLVIQVKTNEDYKYFNCDGDEIIDPNYKDPHNRSIQSIHHRSLYQYRRWTEIATGDNIYIWDGKLTIANKTTGYFHIFIFYRYDNPDVLIMGENKNPTHYTIPKELN